jgi:hypothetical protein
LHVFAQVVLKLAKRLKLFSGQDRFHAFFCFFPQITVLVAEMSGALAGLCPVVLFSL